MVDALAIMFALTREPEPPPEPSRSVATAGATPPPSSAHLYPYAPQPGLCYLRDRFGRWHSSPDPAWLQTWVARVDAGTAYITSPACPNGTCPR